MIPLKDKNDEEVILSVYDSIDNFGIIIFRYQEKLKRYIKRISNIPDEEINDLIQDIFLSVYENLNSFNPKLSFSSWIYRIAHNKTINFWKKNKYSWESLNIDDNLFLVESVFNEKITENEYQIMENKEIISNSLKNIEKKYREVLILKFLEEKNYKEISDILEKPMGTIATLINRAKQKLKKEIEQTQNKKKYE